MRPRVIVLGEKPQGSIWLRYLLRSGLFDIVAGVPRHTDKNVWWETDDFTDILMVNKIPVIRREQIIDIDYDILWSLMYGFIIESNLIEKAKYALNLHESPLPRYRGCNGYSHAILENDNTYGTSFHFLDSELDHGAIIDQEVFCIRRNETAKELYIRTIPISNSIFLRNIANAASGDFQSRPNLAHSEPIRPRRSLEELKKLPHDILYDISLLTRYARALDFTPFEPAYFDHNYSKIYCFVDNSYGRNSLSRFPLIEIGKNINMAFEITSDYGGLRFNFEDRDYLFLESGHYENFFPLLKRY